MAIKFSIVADFPVRSRLEETKESRRTQRTQRGSSNSGRQSHSMSRVQSKLALCVPESPGGKGARPKTPAKKIGP